MTTLSRTVQMRAFKMTILLSAHCMLLGLLAERTVIFLARGNFKPNLTMVIPFYMLYLLLSQLASQLVCYYHHISIHYYTTTTTITICILYIILLPLLLLLLLYILLLYLLTNTIMTTITIVVYSCIVYMYIYLCYHMSYIYVPMVWSGMVVHSSPLSAIKMDRQSSLARTHGFFLACVWASVVSSRIHSFFICLNIFCLKIFCSFVLYKIFKFLSIYTIYNNYFSQLKWKTTNLQIQASYF